jgi:hypothetical protein
MQNISRIFISLFALVAIVGCASTKVTDRQQLVTEQLPRPGQILVYDFVASPGDVPADSAFAGEIASLGMAQTAEQAALGRQLGAEIAVQLVGEIRAMGLPGVRAASYTVPQVNDIVIRGYLLSISEGSAAKRVAIGFGAGGSELKTAVEGFQMTAQGLRRLGYGSVGSGSNKTPGSAVSLGMAIASGNPVGLIVSSGAKIYGEASGKSTVEGRAVQTAKEIAEVLEQRFREEGWIQ